MSERIPDGWKKYDLGQVCEVVGGGTPERSKPEYWSGGICWVSPTEITALRTRYISDTKDKITELGLKNSSAKLHPVGTVLMTSRASIGFPAINTVPMATNQGFQSLRCRDKTDNEFIYQWVTANQVVLERLSSGSTFSEISSANAKKVPIVLPPKPEQQKIASILTSVDEVIEKTEAQISKLQDLKKGMMQELLTKGIGHTEFKDSPVGRIPKEWDVRELGDLFTKIVVGYVGNVNKHYGAEKHGIPFYRTLNVRDGYITHDNIKYVTRGFNEANKKSQIVNEDILIARVGANLGMTCKVDGLNSAANIANVIIIKFSQKCNSDFYAFFLRSNEGQRQILSEAAGGAQGVFNTTLAKSLEVPVPPLDEQNEIAQVLGSLEKNIANVIEKKNQLSALKKALMQDLLTGKVRVKVN